ncbi:MAG: hypothetical protein AB7K71_36710 [Polyangiaceae bacterium]
MSRGVIGLSALSLLLVVACSREESRVEKLDLASARPAAPAVAPTPPATVSCIGEVSAAHHVVYLHGMDTEPLSDQEQHNREVLAAVAKARGVRFALPRASRACPTQPGSVCWGWKFDDAEATAATARISAAAAQCFAGKAYGLLGFSNGGYLLNKLLRSCRLKATLPDAAWMISVGSAKFEGELEAEPKSLAGCGKLLLVSGREDTYNFDPKHHLFELLKAKGADAEHLEYAGGHVLEETALKQALERVAKPE